jgi:hypothetical protein
MSATQCHARTVTNRPAVVAAIWRALTYGLK